MRIAILLSVFLSVNNLTYGQIIFHKMYPEVNGDNVSSLMGFLQMNDSGFLVGNVTALMKLDSLGHKQWRTRFDIPINSIYNSVFSIVPDYDQGFLLAGSKLLISLDSNCNINWYREIISNYYIYLLDSKQTNTDKFIFGGTVDYNISGVPCFLKCDTAGNILWIRLYIANPVVEIVNSFDIESSTGNIFACSNSISVLNPGTMFDGVVLKLDTAGSVFWAKRYTNFGVAINFYGIKSTPDGYFILFGKRNLHNLLMKINSNGDILWSKSYAFGAYGTAFDGICTADGGFAFVGDAVDASPFGNAPTSSFIKTDSAGNVEWSRYMGGFGTVSASKIIQTTDGGFAIAGRRFSAQGNYVLNLIKTDSLGHTAGCLEQDVNIIVSNWVDTVIDFNVTDSLITASTVPFTHNYPLTGTEVDLCNFQGYSEYDFSAEFDIFPNPTYGAFSIKFAKSISQNAAITVFDLIGREMHQMELLVGQEEYKVNFNPEKAGVYFVQLDISGKSYYTKILVFRE